MGEGEKESVLFPRATVPSHFPSILPLAWGSRSLCVPGALVGGCSGRKRPYPCSRRVWQAQRTLARALAAGCNTTAFPGNCVLVLHVFLHLCSLRLVVGMCQAASVTAQLLVRRHRRAKRRAAHAQELTGRARRAVHVCMSQRHALGLTDPCSLRQRLAGCAGRGRALATGARQLCRSTPSTLSLHIT